MKYLLLFLIAFICFTNSWGQKNISYRDSVYLVIKEDLTNEDSLDTYIHRNWPVYSQAHHRFVQNLYVKDHKLAWDIKTGAEIKISENIFEYLVKQTVYNNEVNLPSGDYEIRIYKKDGCYYVVGKKLSMEGFRKLPPQKR